MCNDKNVREHPLPLGMDGKWEAKITRGLKEIRVKVMLVIMAMTPQCRCMSSLPNRLL